MSRRRPAKRPSRERGQPDGREGDGRGAHEARARSSFRLGLPAQLLVLAAAFGVAVGVAELVGAANLGVAFGIGQIVFAITLLFLLLRA